MNSDLIAAVDSLIGAVRRTTAININSKSLKEQAIQLSKDYFETARPNIVNFKGEGTFLLPLDDAWQQLLRLAHGSNAKTSYARVLKSIKGQLLELNISLLSSPEQQKKYAEVGETDSDSKIINTLAQLAPTAAASYRQGVKDLRDTNRLSYRGTASEFREALRETLDHLAPDNAVLTHYKLEQGQTRPTMKQKTAFILTSRGQGKTSREPAEKALRIIEELSGELMRAIYNRASLATHVQQSRAEVEKIKRYIDTMFSEILEIT